MKKLLLILVSVFVFFTLTSCDRESHTIQLGTVSNTGNIELKKTFTDEECYQKIHKLLADAKNIRLSESEVSHFTRQYIQMINERKNILEVNYYMWDDVRNERFIIRPYYEDKSLFYEIIGHNYRMLKKELEKVRASEEELEKKEDKNNNRPVETTWTYDD